MTPEPEFEKLNLDETDWQSSREFFAGLTEELAKLDDKTERYDFTWVGKRKSIIEAGAPINKTLRPDLGNSKNFDTTENLFIEGDNLDALKLLQESYLGKVKMIYIDPPYNTGKDFIYKDNFRASVEDFDEDTEYRDENGNIQFKRNEDTNPRYHSDWLSMMYPRLKLARNLLSEDGVIFISIDDNEQANLKKLCDEVFGEDNFVATLHIEMSLTQGMKVGAAQNGAIVKNGEFIHVYSKNAKSFKVNSVLYDGVPSYDTHFSIFLDKNDEMVPMGDFIKSESAIHHYFDDYKLPRNFSSFCRLIDISEEFRSDIYTNYADKLFQSMMASVVLPEDMSKKLDSKSVVRYQKYILHRVESGKVRQLLPLSATIGLSDDYSPQFGRRRIRGDMWKGFYSDMMNVAKEGGVDYKNGKKPVRLIKQLIRWGSRKDDLIVDFFSGSATTAHAVMQLNAEDGGGRKWIMAQLPEKTYEIKNGEKVPKKENKAAFEAGYETIPDIARERIRRAGDKIEADFKEELAKREVPLDTGFRALRIDDTNYQAVEKTATETSQLDLSNQIDKVKTDRSDLDLLYGVIGELALDFSRPLETTELGGVAVYRYDYSGPVSGLVACFALEISTEVITAIAKLEPNMAVFAESSLPNSEAKVNLNENFKQQSPHTKIIVI